MQQFFDINKFKPGEGILWFPISLARIDNAQRAQMYFEEYIPHITPAKIVTPTIGANFCYGDWLYMRDETPAMELKKKYSVAISKHQNGCKKYVRKPQMHLGQTPKDASFYIPSAFTFDTRSSLYFSYEGDFTDKLGMLYQIYQKDDRFQRYLLEDCSRFSKEVTEQQIMFFLEEHLMMYFIAHMQVKLRNEYVPHHERVLQCYPGKPLKHQIYIMQQDFFKLGTSTNVYQMSRYDLTEKKLYDFSAIDLETYM